MQRKKKERQRLEDQRKHCKLLLRYVDEEYKEEKAKLKPMLKKGLITFELMWAIYKPTSICWTAYGEVPDQVQCLKIQRSFQWESSVRGELYCVQGNSFDYVSLPGEYCHGTANQIATGR